MLLLRMHPELTRTVCDLVIHNGRWLLIDICSLPNLILLREIRHILYLLLGSLTTRHVII